MSKKIITTIVASLASIAIVVTAGYLGFKMSTGQKDTVQTGNLISVEWYNETDPEFTITTVEQLYELAALSDFYDFKGQTIKLGADLVVNEGNAEDWAKEAPARRWKPITGFAGVFDGQGHTISGLYGRGFEIRMALFADTQKSCTVKNLSLVNSYFETSGHRGTASIVSHGGGKFTKIYSDAIIVHRGENVGGIASSIDAQATFEECWFDGDINISNRDCGGIVDEVLGARVTIKHCLFSGSISSIYDVGGTRTGGLIGRADEAATIVLNDSLSSGTIECEKKVYTGAVLGASYSGVQFTMADIYASSATYSSLIGESGKKGSFSGTGLQLGEAELTGVKAYQWTTLNFDSYWAVVEGGTPILKCFAETVPSLEGVKKVYDISWYTPGGFDFTLTTREQLYGFIIVSASTNFQDCKVKLGADIVVNEGDASKWAKEAPTLPWFPIETFAGFFDGQGHTISGLYLKSSNSYLGIFGKGTAPSVIQNFSIKNSYFEHVGTTSAFMGSVVGESYGIVQNIYSNAIIVSEGNQVGGIVGRMNDSASNTSSKTIDGEDYTVISNCWFDGSITMLRGEVENTGACEAGGMVGRVVQGDAIIEHCLNTGTISSNVTGRALMVGGLVGYVVKEGELQLTDCLNVGEIKADYTICVGSVIGRANTPERIVVVKDTYATTESYKVAISKNSLKATVKGDVICVNNSWMTGYKGYQYTTLDFENYWAVVVGPDKTPILSQFANAKPSVKGFAKMVDVSWYKADAKEMVIDSVQDLYGLAMLSSTINFEGQTIKLAKDIAVNPVDAVTLAAWEKGTVVPTNKWMTIGSSRKPFAGTFDGQGHKISGIYSVTDEQYNGLFGATTPKSMIKNLSLVDSYFAFTGSNMTEEGKEAAAYMGSIAGDLRGDMDTVYSNAIVISTANQVGGLVGRANGAKDSDGNLTTCTINNCWFDGKVKLTGKTARYAGGIAAIAVQGTIEITNCLNTGDISNERNLSDEQAQFLAGILGTEWTKCTIKISDCLSAGSVTAAEVAGIGAVVSRIQKDGTVCTINDTYVMKGSCVNTSNNKDVILWSKHKNAKVENNAVLLAEAELLGVEGYKWTNLNFDTKAGYWTARINNIPALQSFVAAAQKQSVAGVLKPDTSWYDKAGEDATDYYIDTAAGLLGFAKLVNGGVTFKDKTVHLTADVDLNPGWNVGDQKEPSNTWVPIGQYKNALFDGTFDGKSHSISGVYCVNNKTDESYVGLFGVLGSNSAVKNVNLLDSYFERTAPYSEKYAFMGSIAGETRGTLNTVYSNAAIKTSYGQVGGLVGRANGMKVDDAYTTVSIKNCWYDGSLSLSGENGVYAAGIAAVAVQGTVDIENCVNTGSVISTGKDSGKMYIAGIIATDWNVSNINLTNCLNAGEIKADGAENFMGAIYGRRNKSGSVYNLYNVYATKDSCTRVNPETQVEESKAHGGGETGTTEIGKTVLKEDLSGIKGYTDTLLDFEKDWVARVNGVPTLKVFAGTGALAQSDIQDLSGVAQNNWYDESVTEYYIGTATAFRGFSDLVNAGNTFAGKKVYLMTDIDLNPGWTAPEDTSGTVSGNPVEWVPIGGSKKFQGTFDGQKHTIKGVYVEKTDENYVALFGQADGATICNLKITNSYFKQSGTNSHWTASLVGAMTTGGTISGIYSDAIIVSQGRQIGGIAGRAEATIKNCWFDGEIKVTRGSDAIFAGGIVGVSNTGANLVVEDCLNTAKMICNYNPSSQKVLSVGGIYGGTYGATPKITIQNCVFSNVITTKSNAVVGSVAGLVNKADTEYEIINCYVRTDSASGDILGGTANSPTGQITDCGKISLVDMQGTKAYELDLNYTVWIARANDVPVPNYFVNWLVNKEDTVADTTGRIYADTSWLTDGTGDGTEANPYKLSSEADFLGFAQEVNKGRNFAGEYIELTADIDMNKGWTVALNESTGKLNGKAPKNAWTPIAKNKNNSFAGTFNGNNKEIKGIYVMREDTAENYYGLFGVIASGATVKNFKLTNSYFECKEGWLSGTTYYALMGSIAGDMRGTLENIYSSAIIYNYNAQQAGGLVGRINDTNSTTGKTTGKDAVILKCWFDGELYLTDSAARCGGIVGVTMANDSYIENCLFTGLVEYSGTGTSPNMGGILGKDHSAGKIYLTNVLSLGTVEGKNGGAAVNTSASVAGNVSASGTTLTVTNVYAGSQCFKKNGTVNQTAYGNFGGSVTNNISKNKKYGIITEANIVGALAANGTVLVNFDFANTWATITTADGVTQDGMPVLSYFKNWYLTNVLSTETE